MYGSKDLNLPTPVLSDGSTKILIFDIFYTSCPENIEIL
jgi:hypothetical protein